MKEQKSMLITSAPQFHDNTSTARIMWTVSICLMPAAVWGVYVFGAQSLAVLFSSIFFAMATEALIAFLWNKDFTLKDGSAFLTGLLIGMNMPPAIPFYIPAMASIFAIAVVKWTFGGLGSNWMNPALAGRVFVFFSWTGDMTSWKMPSTIAGADAVTSASPLGSIKTGLFDYSGSTHGPLQFLAEKGYPHSISDQAFTNWMNLHILHPIGADMPEGVFDLFVGNVPGCIGEVSALLLLLGTVYLFIRKIITWEIPVSYIVTFGFLIWMFGGTRFGGGVFQGNIWFHFFSGGLILGAFYMATDMVTSPLTPKGMLIYGAGAGFLTFLIRLFGSFPEGVSLAIIFMNIFVALINRYTGPKRYGVLRGEEK